MDKQEIFEMDIQEMTEHALEQRRERFDEDEQKKHQELIELSKKKQDILEKLSSGERQIVEDYITKTHLAAQDECEYLYVQGAKDCVELLKKLGVL